MMHNMQNNTVDVQAPTGTKGTSGGEKVAFTTTYSGLPCRVIDAQPTWRIFYAQRNIQVTHQVFTNTPVTVKAGYQLIWGTKTLYVVGVRDLGGAGNVQQIDAQDFIGG